MGERRGMGEGRRRGGVRSGDTGRLNLSLSVEQFLVWPMPVRESVSSLRRLNVVDAYERRATDRASFTQYSQRYVC